MLKGLPKKPNDLKIYANTYIQRKHDILVVFPLKKALITSVFWVNILKNHAEDFDSTYSKISFIKKKSALKGALECNFELFLCDVNYFNLCF